MSTKTTPPKAFKDIMADPAADFILQDDDADDDKEGKASSEVPALLEEQARKLSTQPFTGNPPHHGANAQEVLNTALVRRFAGLSYDKVSADVFTATDKPELGSLLESLKAAQQASASAEQD